MKMRPPSSLQLCVFLMAFGFSLGLAAQTITIPPALQPNTSSYWNDPVNWKQQFVPDSQLFWDNSKHWTTNYGPAYRDTMITPLHMLRCSSQYALCFESGLPP